MFAILTAVLALAAADPSTAGPAEGQAAPAAASSAPKPAEAKVKLVCQDKMPTGTRFPKRQCVEVSADLRQQEIDRKAFEEVQNRPMVEIRRGN